MQHGHKFASLNEYRKTGQRQQNQAFTAVHNVGGIVEEVIQFLLQQGHGNAAGFQLGFADGLGGYTGDHGGHLQEAAGKEQAGQCKDDQHHHCHQQQGGQIPCAGFAEQVKGIDGTLNGQTDGFGILSQRLHGIGEIPGQQLIQAEQQQTADSGQQTLVLQLQAQLGNGPAQCTGKGKNEQGNQQQQ